MPQVEEGEAGGSVLEEAEQEPCQELGVACWSSY